MVTTTHAEGVFGPLKDGLAAHGAIEMFVWLVIAGCVTFIALTVWWLSRWTRRVVAMARARRQ